MHRFRVHPTVAALLMLFTLGLGALPAAAQDAGGEGYDRVVDMTFPISEGSYQRPLYDGYFDSRGGGTRVHRATDVMASKMVPLHAVVDGEICKITGVDEPMPSYGYALTLCGDDGLEYSYIHINDDSPGTADDDPGDGDGGPENAYAPGIAKGVRVERGQHIAWVGDSGNGPGIPHVHFEIYDVDMAEQSGRLNPYPSLIAAEERGDFPDAPAPIPPCEPAEAPADDGAPAPAQAPGCESSVVNDSGPVGDGDFSRLAGTNRLETAVALSVATHDSARAVIIVPADSHVEALVAAPLAGLLDSPILLSGRDGLAGDVIAEVRRLDAPNAYVMGTTAQLGSQVEQDLSDAGVHNIARITAQDRYALSAAVAREILTYPEVPRLDQVILALGDADEESRAWPDALSASALAAGTRTPVLLVQGSRLPDSVEELLAQYQPSRVIVIGGTAAISAAVADDAAAAAGGQVNRLAGPTRYGTSVAVASAAQNAGLNASTIWIATGRNFPDALAAGPAAALAGSPLLLVDGVDINGSPESEEWLSQHTTGLLVVGGSSVISDEVAAALAG